MGYEEDSSLFYPPRTGRITIDSRCAQGVNVNNPFFDCYGAYFVKTSARYYECFSENDCYYKAAPREWYYSKAEGYRVPEPCRCDLKLRSCIINRRKHREFQWAFCR
ncbi:unnamed protein product [Caenorhabditis angaria]|uniref:Uncharacterized protein n=1 Tax=Caenorhabditis angaria TaxID=860376 RepID=A0A9P1MWL2_9PELO|nr:unnamed protein product [Caenorhabditis angaria]